MKKTILFAAILAASMNANATLFCDGDNTPGIVTWNVGQNTDAMHALSFDTGVECFATGAELHFIQQNYPGLRNRLNVKFINWYGEDAQFIVGNL